MPWHFSLAVELVEKVLTRGCAGIYRQYPTHFAIESSDLMGEVSLCDIIGEAGFCF